jgi:nicotinamide riboside kinase
VDYPAGWEDVVVELWKRYDNHVAFLERGPWFDDRGRVHNLQKSLEIDQRIAVLLDKHNITYTQVDYGYQSPGEVLDAIMVSKA